MTFLKINSRIVIKNTERYLLMNIVKLAYYDEFHCVGGRCKDSCCKYWHIDISQKEYFEYKEMKCSPELRAVMDEAFKEKINGTDVAFAEMKLKESGNCPFLDNDSLCTIQKELGENALCFSCSVFPRLHMKAGSDTVMMSCSPTCCRVTELLMSHPEGLKIIETQYDGQDEYINKDLFTLPRLKPDSKEFPYYHGILYTQMAILQNRRFTVPERMLILGYFCQKTDEYIKNNEMHKIAPLSEMLLDNEICEKITDSLKPKQSDERIASSSVKILYKMYLNARSSHSPFVSRSFNQFMGRLAVTSSPIGRIDTNDGDEPNISFNLEEYGRLTDVFGKIMRERPYIAENLLVNLVFSQNIQDGVWTNYFTLAIFYNTLKVCVPTFLNEDFTDEELAVAVTYAVKLVLNTNLAKSNILVDSMIRKKYSLPYAVFLIC